MKEGWKLSKFQDLFLDPKKAIISGPFGSNLKSSEYQSEGVPLVRLQNVDRWNFINKNIIYITAQKAKNLSNHAYKAGDILITKLGAPLGKACIAPEESGEGVILADIVRVRLDDGFLNKDFVLHQLNSEGVSNQLKGLTTGATRPRVTLKNMREVNLVVPPLSEQEAIVAILDKAFTAIDQAKANIEQNIANAKELFQSKLNQIFSQKGEGWVEKTLGEVFTFRQGIQRGVKLQSEDQTDGQVRFLRIIDYTQGNELPRYIDNPGEQYIINDDDINLVRYGASTGFVCKGLTGALANNLFRIIPRDDFNINSNYLYYFLDSPIFQGYIKSEMNGAAMPAISFGMISNMSFPLVTPNMQRNIISEISEIETKVKLLVKTSKTKLASLDELKKSILQKAFAGELT